jgi:hypothetical protein
LEYRDTNKTAEEINGMQSVIDHLNTELDKAKALVMEHARLTAELEQVKRKNEGMLSDLHGLCEKCKHREECVETEDKEDALPGFTWWSDCPSWEYLGLCAENRTAADQDQEMGAPFDE